LQSVACQSGNDFSLLCEGVESELDVGIDENIFELRIVSAKLAADFFSGMPSTFISFDFFQHDTQAPPSNPPFCRGCVRLVMRSLRQQTFTGQHVHFPNTHAFLGLSTLLLSPRIADPSLLPPSAHPPFSRVHALHTPYTRPTHALHTPYTRPTHALHTPYTRPTHALHTPYTHPTHALHTPYTRPAHAQATPMRQGLEPEYDFTAQYVLTVDDLFLHYASTSVLAFEVNQSWGTECQLVARTDAPLRELLQV
jgi:hypothetical protein